MLRRLRRALLALRVGFAARQWLRPHQGDVFVLRTPAAVLEDDPEYLTLLARRLRDGVHRQTGARVQVLVLAEGLDIGLLSPAQMRRLGWVREREDG